MGKGWGLLHSYLGPCTKVGHLQASLKLDEQDIHWLECCNCTDVVNEGIEMAGIANIFFLASLQGHHKVARISTVLHEWQPPGLDPNHVVSNFG